MRTNEGHDEPQRQGDLIRMKLQIASRGGRYVLPVERAVIGPRQPMAFITPPCWRSTVVLYDSRGPIFVRAAEIKPTHVRACVTIKRSIQLYV